MGYKKVIFAQSSTGTIAIASRIRAASAVSLAFGRHRRSRIAAETLS
jgi:hypothetical protein